MQGWRKLEFVCKICGEVHYSPTKFREHKEFHKNRGEFSGTIPGTEETNDADRQTGESDHEAVRPGRGDDEL